MSEIRKARYTDGPNDSGYYSAGIDIQLPDEFHHEVWHCHAIEFHSKIQEVAETRRDIAFDVLKGLI